MQEKYIAKTTTIDNGTRGWNYLDVTIYQKDEEGAETPIGNYQRNYPNFFETFYPFTKNGKDYALYSRHYTATRVMELPSCTDLGGEEPSGKGFCPVEYYIPDEDNDDLAYAFISGCIWGDTDLSLQHLDLSEIEQGKIKRDERYGQHDLPRNVSLKDAIEFDRTEKNAMLHIATFDIYIADRDGNVTQKWSREQQKYVPMNNQISK